MKKLCLNLTKNYNIVYGFVMSLNEVSKNYSFSFKKQSFFSEF